MPMFDPDTGKVIDRNALRSIQWSGRAARKPRTIVRDGCKITQTISDTTGEVDGFITEHPNGRVDNTVLAESVKTGVDF